MAALTAAPCNIHRCCGGDGRFAPERGRRVLDEFDGGRDLLAFLAGDACRAIAGPTLFRENARYGNALLARLAAAQVACQDLGVPGREPRGAHAPGSPASGATGTIGERSRRVAMNSGRGATPPSGSPSAFSTEL